ncbi:MAG: TolC family protein [Archangiaceae bacterium]|nr:TolC family protein [Archangiaceae bacterium]
MSVLPLLGLLGAAPGLTPAVSPPAEAGLTLRSAAERMVTAGHLVQRVRVISQAQHQAAGLASRRFAPSLGFALLSRQASEPVYGPQFSYLQPNLTVITQTTRAELGLRGRLPLGTEYGLGVHSDVIYSNGYVPLSPLYVFTADTWLEQPLLRFLGPTANSLPIVVEQLDDERASEAVQLEIDLGLRRVAALYWSLVQALAILEVRQKAIGITQRFVELTEKLIRGGKLSPAANLPPRSDLATRQAEEVAARVQVESARQALLAAIASDPDELADLQPAEAQRSDLSLTAPEVAVKSAFERRSEVKVASARQRLARAQADLSHELQRWDLKLYVRGSVSGISGQNRCVDGYLSNGLTPCAVPAEYAGTALTGVMNVASGRAYLGEVGLKVDLPLGNADAYAQAAKALGAQRAEDELYQQVRVNVALEARRAALLLGLARERLTQTEAAQAVSEQSQDSVQRRFELGAATAIDVQRAQDQQIISALQHAIALAEFNAAWWELEWAKGTIASQLGVLLDAAERGPAAQPAESPESRAR